MNWCKFILIMLAFVLTWAILGRFQLNGECSFLAKCGAVALCYFVFGTSAIGAWELSRNEQ